MLDHRLQRTRASLPEGYQFGDGRPAPPSPDPQPQTLPLTPDPRARYVPNLGD